MCRPLLTPPPPRQPHPTTTANQPHPHPHPHAPHPTPTLLTLTLDVYPLMKWYMACSSVSLLTGGRTPNASQHSSTTLRGWGPTQGTRALSMYVMG
jgi:hypothetical protein